VQVHCEEGLAIHLGPEPCVCIREDAGEASAGECIGQPLSRETSKIPGADAFQIAEGNTDGRDNASAWTARRGRRPWHVWTLLDGNREVSCLACGRTPQARIGKARSRSR
jgi:hypothetical protein